MFVYRITLAMYADKLQASGRAARWNSNDIGIIYTSSSQSLACLENVVHRNQLGLNSNFKVLTISIPDTLKIKIIKLEDLPAQWKDFDSIPYTQSIGDLWIKENKFPVLQVPSSIIKNEINYLINPAHPNFSEIKIVSTDAFVFDERIKR